MTALEKYVRLEALGRWRETPGGPPREVVVSFGDATLMLQGLDDRPLGHWALAGVQAIGVDGDAALYAMGPDAPETLAIADREMIAAIAAVTRAHRLAPKPPPAPSRLRAWLGPLTALAVFAAAATFTPDLAREQAARMLPPEAAEEFGDEMLLRVMAETGPLCADPDGGRVYAALAAKVGDGETARLRALSLGGAPVALLPGPTIALGREALERAEDPAEVAGWIALALAEERRRPGPQRLMDDVGSVAALRYVFSGALNEAALARATRAALAPPDPADVAAAYDRLEAAGIATAPFADGLRRFGFDAPPGVTEGAPALGPADWAALKRLCAAR
jgi:hypothetical protein